MYHIGDDILPSSKGVGKIRYPESLQVGKDFVGGGGGEDSVRVIYVAALDSLDYLIGIPLFVCIQ